MGEDNSVEKYINLINKKDSKESNFQFNFSLDTLGFINGSFAVESTKIHYVLFSSN